MADTDHRQGIRVSPPPTFAVSSPDPPAWPPGTQWWAAAIIACFLGLLVWRGWGLTRYSARPLALEKNASVAPPQERDHPPPRLVRAKVADEIPAPGKKKPPESPIDINRARPEELMQLPGIGKTLAARILEARKERPFRSVEELRQVKGIGAKTLEKLRPHLVVGPPEK